MDGNKQEVDLCDGFVSVQSRRNILDFQGRIKKKKSFIHPREEGSRLSWPHQ